MKKLNFNYITRLINVKGNFQIKVVNNKLYNIKWTIKFNKVNIKVSLFFTMLIKIIF